MIDINLVPLDSRKKSARAHFFALPLDIPFEMLLGGACVLILVLLTHIVLLGALIFNSISLNAQKSNWQKMLPQKNNIDSVGASIKDTSQKLTAIGNIAAPKTIGWSRRLNVISDSLTKGMWLRKITWDNTALTLEGSAVSKNQNEITSVSTFVASLKKDESFAHDFSSIEVNSIQKNKKGATDITDFIVSAKLK